MQAEDAIGLKGRFGEPLVDGADVREAGHTATVVLQVGRFPAGDRRFAVEQDTKLRRGTLRIASVDDAPEFESGLRASSSPIGDKIVELFDLDLSTEVRTDLGLQG